MAEEIKVLVGEQTQSDGSVPYVRGTKEGGLIADALHGKFYELVKRGRVFIASSAVGGIALPIYSATTQLFMLWNPANSGVNLELICAAFGRVSTAGVASHLCWGYKTAMGSATGTGAPCSAYTAGTPVNALLGGDGDSTTKFAPATATVTAPSYLRPTGISQVEHVDAATDAPYTVIEDFERNPLVLAPGSALFACNAIAASTTWAIAITYARVPA